MSGIVEPIVVEEAIEDATAPKKAPRPMSVMERMRMIDIEDEIATSGTPKEVNDEKKTDYTTTSVEKETTNEEDKPVETKTAAAVVIEEMKILDKRKGTRPKKGTKRRIIFDIGISRMRDRTITNIANELSCSSNMIKRHLRYVNERDGYSYQIYSDDTFVIN